ncbi:hypothetical protein QAD02_013605 [Eretmocerus hayati]|uniref:Uncharacterized protein n=1 Tax=Eretmocerus hayati TaxID=131215 RepID=A0ACC2P3Y2_9HYME|nr:hypothetical protein QAD02_013605 [Eretmocerus hayati]
MGEKRNLYDPAWEKDPVLKEWVASVPDDPESAYCRICETPYRAIRDSLLRHAQFNEKHIKRQELIDDIQNAGPSAGHAPPEGTDMMDCQPETIPPPTDDHNDNERGSNNGPLNADNEENRSALIKIQDTHMSFNNTETISVPNSFQSYDPNEPLAGRLAVVGDSTIASSIANSDARIINEVAGVCTAWILLDFFE